MIYFDTPTFQLIRKDKKANIAAKLSAVGGTMGLMTGFSIISGVEIIYFAVKIGLKCLRKRLEKVKAHTGLQKRVDLPNPRSAIFTTFLTKSLRKSRV